MNGAVMRCAAALPGSGRGLMAARPRDGFTVDDIVQSAGVAKGSFYNHFPDKKALALPRQESAGTSQTRKRWHFPDKKALADEVYRTIRAREKNEIDAANEAVREPAVRIARAMTVYARLALTSPDEARIITLGQVGALSVESSADAGLVRDIAEGFRIGKLIVPSIEAAALLVIGQTAVLMSRLQTVDGRDAAALLAQQCIALTLLGLGLGYRTAHFVSAQAVEDILRSDDPSRLIGNMPD